MIALKLTTDRNVIDFTPHLRRKRLENSRLVRKSIDQIIAEADEALSGWRQHNNERCYETERSMQSAPQPTDVYLGGNSRGVCLDSAD
jgi:hypothetical protein